MLFAQAISFSIQVFSSFLSKYIYFESICKDTLPLPDFIVNWQIWYYHAWCTNKGNRFPNRFIIWHNNMVASDPQMWKGTKCKYVFLLLFRNWISTLFEFNKIPYQTMLWKMSKKNKSQFEVVGQWIRE